MGVRFPLEALSDTIRAMRGPENSEDTQELDPHDTQPYIVEQFAPEEEVLTPFSLERAMPQTFEQLDLRWKFLLQQYGEEEIHALEMVKAIRIALSCFMASEIRYDASHLGETAYFQLLKQLPQMYIRQLTHAFTNDALTEMERPFFLGMVLVVVALYLNV